jgi:hypothetical protein
MLRTIHGWGFNYFKMDGLSTGTATEQIYVNDGYRDDHIGSNAPFHDPRKTNLEVFRDGLKRLRQAAGPEVFFSGCNVSQNMRTLGGCLGLVDSMRIGPDNGHRWGDYRQEIASNGSGSIITGPIRGTRLYFLNGRVWWNDPDPTYVRASIPLLHARLITSWVALSGQFYLNSDWIPGRSSSPSPASQNDRPAHDQRAPEVMVPVQLFSKHHCRQQDGEHHAQLVHGRYTGCLTQLKSAEITEPGQSGGNARENEKKHRALRQLEHGRRRVGRQRDGPRERKDDCGPHRRRQVGIDSGNADLGKDSGDSSEKSRQQGPTNPVHAAKSASDEPGGSNSMRLP